MLLFGWILGSVSPLEVLRGMLDMSLRWWRVSPILILARAFLLLIMIWGIVNLAAASGKGLILIGAALLGLLVLRNYSAADRKH